MYSIRKTERDTERETERGFRGQIVLDFSTDRERERGALHCPNKLASPTHLIHFLP